MQLATGQLSWSHGDISDKCAGWLIELDRDSRSAGGISLQERDGLFGSLGIYEAGENSEIEYLNNKVERDVKRR